MSDVHDQKTRSYNMSKIKGANTKPEILVRKYLHSHGFRYRLNVKTLPGKPDLYFPKYKIVVEVRGCFWHGHSNCKYFKLPKTKTEWWNNKISSTKIRDQKNEERIRNLGLKTIIIWECELKKDKRVETLNWLKEEIKK